MYVLQKITFQQGVHSSLDPYVVTSCLHVESWQPGDFKISGKERRREGSNLGQGRNKLIKPSKDACLQPCQKSEEENCFIYLHPFDSRCAPPRKKNSNIMPHILFSSQFLYWEKAAAAACSWPDLPIIQRREAYKKAKAFSLTNSRRLKKPPCTGLFSHSRGQTKNAAKGLPLANESLCQKKAAWNMMQRRGNSEAAPPYNPLLL